MQMRFVRPVLTGSGLVVVLCLVGCHSAFVEATVLNRTDKPLALVEVDYPSASFGTQDLAAGAEYHYRFKVLGNGATKLIWTDAAHQEHTVAGPDLQEGDEGKLTVTFSAAGPVWAKTLSNHGVAR